MRLKIILKPLHEGSVTFPLNYNYGIESFIYRHISKKLAEFLHNKGYILGKRTFKLFNFSRLSGKFSVEFPAERISFNGDIGFYISSPLDDFIEQFAENLVRSPDVRLFKQPFLVSSVEVYPTPVIADRLVIKMLSPVTVYSTLLSPEGKKKTYYYSPFENEFSNLISGNLNKKYYAFHKTTPKSNTLTIVPVKVTKRSEKIVKYTPTSGPYTIIKGWMGIYKLIGNPQLICIGYDTGIGSKNCQGFGMFEIIKGSGLNI